MISTLGTTSIAVGDADILIALAKPDDSLNAQATAGTAALLQAGVMVVFPNTSFAEAITTLQRKYSNPGLADFVAKQYKEAAFAVAYVDEEIMKEAVTLYDPYQSKKKTIFDAMVAATARKLQTNTIFSFDDWYKKLGFTIAPDFIPKA